MKLNRSTVLKITLVVLSCTLLASWLVNTIAGEPGARRARRGKLVHMVAFKFKAEAGKEQIQKVEEAFAALRTKIPEIATFEWGTNVSPEKLDKGFTHGYILTFQTEKDRDTYLEHSEHKAFGKSLGPVLADVLVIDFWRR
jgi:hypothetical protein